MFDDPARVKPLAGHSKLNLSSIYEIIWSAIVVLPVESRIYGVGDKKGGGGTKNHNILVVRSPGKGGSQIPHLDFQKLKGHFTPVYNRRRTWDSQVAAREWIRAFLKFPAPRPAASGLLYKSENHHLF